MEFEDEKKVEDALCSDDCIFMERLKTGDIYLKMKEFIEFVHDKALKKSLAAALQSPGSFRRFSEILAGSDAAGGYKQMWLDFYNSFLWGRAMDFLIASLAKKKSYEDAASGYVGEQWAKEDM